MFEINIKNKPKFRITITPFRVQGFHRTFFSFQILTITCFIAVLNHPSHNIREKLLKNYQNDVFLKNVPNLCAQTISFLLQTSSANHFGPFYMFTVAICHHMHTLFIDTSCLKNNFKKWKFRMTITPWRV